MGMNRARRRRIELLVLRVCPALCPLSAGAVTQNEKGGLSVSGLKSGMLNVVVTDQISGARSQVVGNMATSFIPANGARSNDLPHEMAHHFMHDTWNPLNRLLSKDPIGMFLLIDNAATDITNDTGRFVMNHVSPPSRFPQQWTSSFSLQCWSKGISEIYNAHYGATLNAEGAVICLEKF